MMHYGGYKCQKGFVYQVFAIYDTDLSGEINFKEFVKMMTLKPCENDKPEDIERVQSISFRSSTRSILSRKATYRNQTSRRWLRT